jgi:hypothetical protein
VCRRRAPMPAFPSAHQEYCKGRLAQHEMRDADPELVRAARECSEPGARTLYHHQGRAARDRQAIRRLPGLSIRGVARTAGGTTSPAPSSSAPPAQREPRGSPGLNRSSGRTTIAGSSRRVLVALTLPAAWLADNGRAGLRSTMTCAVWRAARTRGGFSCRSGVVHMVFAFGMFSVFRSVAVVLHSYLPARWPPPVPEGGGRAWARAR